MSGGSYSVFVIVPAANPLAFRRATFNPVAGGLTTITDLAFNPETQHYMMTWFELSSGSYARVAEIDAAGGVIGQGIASTALGSYDSLSIAYNQSSRTFALVGVDRPTGSVATDQLLVTELNSHGVRFSAEQAINTGLTPVVVPACGAESPGAAMADRVQQGEQPRRPLSGYRGRRAHHGNDQRRASRRISKRQAAGTGQFPNRRGAERKLASASPPRPGSAGLLIPRGPRVRGLNELPRP